MKRLILLFVLAGGLLLSACETRVVSYRPVTHRRVVYSERASHDRVVYRDSTPNYRNSYRDDRVIVVAPGQTNRDYPRRSLDRSYGF